MDDIIYHQKNLWDQISIYHLLHGELKDDFFRYPRHEFLSRFSVDYENWIELNSKNLKENLDLIYADATLLLFDYNDYLSTISQPSLVIRMLDMLDIEPGMSVFELGTGSGWNAALMGGLVGKEGRVITTEIIPAIAEQAKRHLQKFDLPQVEVRTGDAQIIMKEEGLFDRGIFTAGALDLPLLYFEKIKQDGLLLFVLKTQNVDLLLLLKKEDDYFQEIDRLPCLFVPVKGEVPKERTLGPEILSYKKIQIHPKNHHSKHKIIAEGELCVYTESA